ncbi:MAG: DUF3467 domain-containing protein [candidate division Zixibacteria bacterium]|nr:DUF3467 domain-containing protein [candidate division Zixibacteria bacterium]
MAEEKKKKPEPDAAFVQPDIPDEVADGAYANVAQIVFSPAEFVFDFGRAVPGRSGFKIISRIITTPLHAKQFLLTLSENVSRFEGQFGEIKIPQRPVPTGPEDFKQ